MKTKKVTRYECDFCKKRGYSAGHMRKHEQRCTMNPGRECGVCEKMLDQGMPDLKKLIAMVPDNWACECFEFSKSDDVPDVDEGIVNTALVEIYDAAGGCPNCTAAAFRQAGVPLRGVTDFHWKAELAAIWAGINQERLRNEPPEY